MTRDDLVAHCLAKPGAWLDRPWDEQEVAKVGSRIFAFLGSPLSGTTLGVRGGTVGVKCGPDREVADEWLLRYPQDASVLPYIGRSGWNSLRIDGGIPDDELLEAVDASYEAVVRRLPRRERPPAVD